MGFKYDDKAIKCPLYKNVVRTTNGKFIGIVCTNCRFNLGFEAEPCIRFKHMDDLKDFTQLFCKDRYEHCPWYPFNAGKD